MPWHVPPPESKLHRRDEGEKDIKVWDDPEWGPALDALEGYPIDGGDYTGVSDPEPLAQLLLRRPVPWAVRQRLGELLLHPWGKKGPRLSLHIPPRWSQQGQAQKIIEMITLRQQINEARERLGGKLEAALAEVGRVTGRGRSFLLEAWSYDERKAIEKAAGFSQLSFRPREPEGSCA